MLKCFMIYYYRRVISMGSEIKNLIFDFDGTLADTSSLIVATMQRSIEEIGLPFKNSDEIKATIGIRLEEIPLRLWPDLKISGEEFATVYRKNFEVLKDKVGIRLFPEVRETLTALNEKGCRMAIATSRSLESLMELTEMLGIREFFSYFLGGDNVKRGKPDPESVYIILSECRWLPENTMMTGDMPVDIMMGKNAGLYTCGVTYGNGREVALREAGADKVISQFKNLELIIA